MVLYAQMLLSVVVKAPPAEKESSVCYKTHTIVLTEPYTNFWPYLPQNICI